MEAAVDCVPLSRGMIRGDQDLDPRPLPRELVLRLPVIGGDPAREIRSCVFGVDAADIVLFPRGPSLVSLIVPEVEVPPSVEVSDAGPAADFHFIPLSRGIFSVGFPLPVGGVRNCPRASRGAAYPEVQIPGPDEGCPAVIVE